MYIMYTNNVILPVLDFFCLLPYEIRKICSYQSLLMCTCMLHYSCIDRKYQLCLVSRCNPELTIDFADAPGGCGFGTKNLNGGAKYCVFKLLKCLQVLS